jgi:hypothetical protein
MARTKNEFSEPPPDDDDLANWHITCYWCARKAWGFVDEFRGNAPLDNNFFRHLEELGKVRLTSAHRGQIQNALLHYSEPSHFGPKGQIRAQSMRKIAKHAAALFQEMQSGGNDYASWVEFHITPPWVKRRGAEWWREFATTLQSIKEEAKFSNYMREQLPEATTQHRPRNDPVIELVREVGHVYLHAGGRAKISNNGGVYQGPYAAFLKAIWEVIPNNMRPASPNAFARTAIEYFANCRVVHRNAKPRQPTSRSRKPRVITRTRRKSPIIVIDRFAESD